jgi:predicted nucleotidyltransferase
MLLKMITIVIKNDNFKYLVAHYLIMFDILQTKSAWTVINVFLAEPWKQIHLRALIRETGVGPNVAHKIIKNIEKSGVLKSKNVGNIILYSLNQESELTKKLLMLYHEKKLQELPEEFKIYIQRLRRKLEGRKILSVVLFGSVAKNRAGEMSDIDLLIIHGGKFNDERLRNVFENYSRYIQIIDFSSQEFEKNYRDGHELIVNMLNDGIIVYDNNFYYNYLFKPLPKPTKDYIERILKDSEKRLDEFMEFYRKVKKPEIAKTSLYLVLSRLTTAMLLLNHHIPQSKKGIKNFLEKVKERELAHLLEKTRKIWDGEDIVLSKEQIEKAINTIREKIIECYIKLEKYETD